MILINNQVVELPKSLREQLQKEIGKEGKRINYVKRYRKVAPLYNMSGQPTGQYAPVQPKAKNFPMRAVDIMLDMTPDSETYLQPVENGTTVTVEVGTGVKTENGITTLRNVTRFATPKKIVSNEYEHYWFLKYICPYIENGAGGKKSKVHHYEIENKEAEATARVTERKVRVKVEHLLSADEAESGISYKKLCELAYAYAIANPMNMQRDLLSDTILNRVQIDERTREYSHGSDLKGYEFFISLIDNKVDFRYRVAAQKAIDDELIGFDANTQCWRRVADKTHLGTPHYFGGVIAKVGEGIKPMVGLLDFMRKNPNIVAEFEESGSGEAGSAKVASPKKSLDEMSEVEIALEQVDEMKKNGNFLGAISILENLMEVDRANRQSYSTKIMHLKKKMAKAE